MKLIGAILGGVLAIVIVTTIASLSAVATGFILMLLAGSIHSDVYAQVPAFSYWQSILVAFTLTFVGGLVFNRSHNSN